MSNKNITPAYIENANEWQIRSLIDSVRWPLVGNLSDILSISEAEQRLGGEIDPLYTRNTHVGDMMRGDHSRVQLSITDIVSKQVSDGHLVGDNIDLGYDWLRIPSDEHKYLIILIIKKFLNHQWLVHRNNMTRPSEIEERDYRHLRLLHNYVIEDAETWINRIPYTIPESFDTSAMDVILSGGPEVTSYGDEEVSERRTLSKMDTPTFGALIGNKPQW